MPVDDSGDADLFEELTFLDTPYRLAREVSIFDNGRNIYTVDDRDIDTRIDDLNNKRYIRPHRIAKDADQVTVLFLAERITGTFGASSGHIAARAFYDGTSQLVASVGRNPGTLKRWSDLRTELDRLGLLASPNRRTVTGRQDERVALVKPNEDAPFDDWFAYYHACRRDKVHYTLKDLANDVGYDYQYIRQLHSKYKKEHAD
jgi:hypothetical protein